MNKKKILITLSCTLFLSTTQIMATGFEDDDQNRVVAPIWVSSKIFQDLEETFQDLEENFQEQEKILQDQEEILQEQREQIAAKLAALPSKRRDIHKALLADHGFIKLSEQLSTLRTKISSGFDAEGQEIDIAAHIAQYKRVMKKHSKYIFDWHAQYPREED